MSTLNVDEDYDNLENSATKEENISNALHEISETISHGRDVSTFSIFCFDAIAWRW